MSDRLLLRLASDGRLSWLRQTADGRVLGASQDGAPDKAELAAASEIVVLVPAEDVLLASATVPARNRSQQLQAVPFALEDQLIGAVEDLHFAVAAGAGDDVSVAVVAQARLREWLAQLQTAGIQPDVLLPETLAMPLPADGGSLLLSDDRALVRLAAWSGFACARDDLDDWLQQARAAGFEGELHPLQADGQSADVLALLAQGVRQAPINLLGGEFGASHRQAGGSRWWRRAAMLAAAALVLAFVLRGLEVVQLSRAVDAMETSMQDIVRQTFPELGPAELRMGADVLMRNRLQDLSASGQRGGLMRLLGQVAPILGSTTQSRLRGLEYRNGLLEVALIAPDVATLDSLRERIAAIPGLGAEVTAANPAENGVDGRIRIVGATP